MVKRMLFKFGRVWVRLIDVGSVKGRAVCMRVQRCVYGCVVIWGLVLLWFNCAGGSESMCDRCINYRGVYMCVQMCVFGTWMVFFC